MAVIDAQGTIFRVGTATANTAICIRSYTGFDGEAAERDVTTLCSEAKEYRMGLIDNGNISCEVFFDPADAGQVILATARETGAVLKAELELSNGYVADFEILVRSLPSTAGVDGSVEGTLNMRITGPVDWTAPTP